VLHDNDGKFSAAVKVLDGVNVIIWGRLNKKTQ